MDLYRTDGPALGENGTYGAITYNNEIERVIQSHDVANAAAPLFLYVALQCMHAPEQVTTAFSALFPTGTYTSNYAVYNGMGAAADSVFGNATSALKRRGMWGSTLVVVMSDNGGPVALKTSGGNANNYPLRGGKKTEFEGGIRVNAFVSGGFVPASLHGQTRDGYVHVCDWCVTRNT